MTKPKIAIILVLFAASISLLSLILISQGILVLPGDSDDDLVIEAKTAILELQDLQVFKDLDGILEYSDSISILPSENGILTYIAPEGSELRRGSVVFRLHHSSSDSELLIADQQLSSAEATIAQAELAWENLNAPAAVAQVASAEAAIAQAELAWENLNAPATVAQIASANSAVTQAESNLVTAQGNLDRIWVSYRVARENYCAQERRFLKGSSLSLDTLCSEENLPMIVDQVNAIQNHLFAVVANPKTQNQITSLAENLITQHTHYQSAVESRNFATGQVSVARINLAALNDPPTAIQITQANAALKSAHEQRSALDETPTAAQVTQGNASLKSAQAVLTTALSTINDLAERSSATVLMFGDMPAWRELREGVSPGQDVIQLKQNLILLSYGSNEELLANQDFDGSTSDAVKQMQADLGLTVTGHITLGDLVFLPGPSIVNYSLPLPNLGINVNPVNALVTLTTIESIETTTGLGGVISIISKSLQRVQTSIEVSNQDLIDIGSKVNIELPDESVIVGTVREIGKIAVIPEANLGGEPYLEVSISLDGGVSLPEWTGAPVIVSVTKEVAQNVLAAPVTSLLAILEGGYALEILTQNSTKLVPVEVGIYADGWVEVDGSGLEPGIEVVLP
jgi:hypothetical protein